VPAAASLRTGSGRPRSANIEVFTMRGLLIIGAVLLGGGLFVLIKAPTYSSEDSVLKVGNLEAKMQREHSIPPWVGGIGIGAGLVLIFVGFKKS
jgi:hypothetical protein